MDVSSEYHSNNKLLIDTINAKEGQKTFDTVLDIGCGCGNVTKDVAKQLKFNRLVGLDIDLGMVQQAILTNSIPNSFYHTADIQSPFDQLPEQLKQLQGQCSMIFSIHTFHWVPDIESSVTNISKFLAPGARAYIFMHQLKSAMQVPEDKRQVLEETVPWVKGQNYVLAWKEAVRKAGMTIEFNDVQSETPLSERFYNEMFDSFIGSWIKKYIKDDDDLAKMVVDQFRSRFEPIIVDGQNKYLIKMNDWLLVIENPE